MERSREPGLLLYGFLYMSTKLQLRPKAVRVLEAVLKSGVLRYNGVDLIVGIKRGYVR